MAELSRIWRSLYVLTLLAPAAGLAQPSPALGKTDPAAAPARLRVSDSLQDCLNVRLTPSIDIAPVDCLTPGTPVTVTGRASGWREIALSDDRRGWVSRRYLEPDLEPPGRAPTLPADLEVGAAQGIDRGSPDPAPMYVHDSVHGCLNVRSAPGLGAPAIDCLAPGTPVDVTGAEPGWREVAFGDGQHGWVAQRYLATSTTPHASGVDATITLSLRDTPIEEVYEMLSRQARVNILLSKGVEGLVSVSLYELTVAEAIRAVAAAAGYVVEKTGNLYLVVSREDAGKDVVGGNTEIRTIKVQYTDPAVVAELLTKHLSRYGKITTLPGRNLLVVEDLPEFLDRLVQMIADIDVEPRQILIEAKILEIALDADQVYGIDWTVPFSVDGGVDVIGTQGLAPRGIAGIFAELVTPHFELFINALSSKGRVRTLSTPKILVLENEEAEVVIGDRTGYRVTTTINQVTTESVEFVESGVILKVRVSVDRAGRVLLSIHPEVSSATVTDGIPSLTTTEVTTQMLAEDGQKIFIGGLIRNSTTESRSGVPGLSDLPVVGGLFSRTNELALNTETIVLITPHIVDARRRAVAEHSASKIEHSEEDFRRKRDYILHTIPSANPLMRAPGAEQSDGQRHSQAQRR